MAIRNTILHHFQLRYLLIFLFCSIAAPATAQYKIMCLGNSITQGNLEHPGYRYKLWQMLLDAGIEAELVGSHDTNSGGDPAVKNSQYKGRTYTNHNEGHWGWSTDEVLNGRDGKGSLSQWLETYTPDIALIHLGSNDMFRQCGTAASPGNKCYQETIKELKEVVQQIRAKNPTVKILLAQLIPAYDQKVGPAIAQNIQDLNKRMPALAQELHTAASPVILVDQNTGFDPTTGVDTWDGIHPNASGEEKMAQKWLEEILPITVLPVELTSFTVSSSSQGLVHLKWQTASETDNALFEVQRSTDAINFTAIGRVAGAGNTMVPQTYHFTDSTASLPELYYRLKQVDTDGTSSFSQIVLAKVPEQVQALTVYPTVSKGHGITLHLQHDRSATKAKLYIYTMEGKLVQRPVTLKGQNGAFSTKILLNQLHGAGLYLVRVTAGGKLYQSEFLVE